MRRLVLLLSLAVGTVALQASPANAFHELDSFERTANTGGGAGSYYTGSPRFKGYNCNICHTNAEHRISAQLGTELTTGQYKPGLIYPITVRLVGEHRGLMSAFNPNTFTAEILGVDGKPLGSLTAAAGGIVSIVDGGHIAVAEGFGTGETEWRFSWASPGTGAPATLYLAMLDGDGASDPENRFIDPLNDDVATLVLPLCPEGQMCAEVSSPPEETSPAGCSSSGAQNGALLAVFALLGVLMLGRRRRYVRRPNPPITRLHHP